MSEYRNLLVCLDLTEDSVRVLERARALATSTGGTLTLLHVVEYVPVDHVAVDGYFDAESKTYTLTCTQANPRASDEAPMCHR